MEWIGQAIVYIMMAFLLIGAVSSIIDDKTGFGKEFKDGIMAIGTIFIPIAGVLVFLPILFEWIPRIVGPFYAWLHADPAMAAGMLLPGDMGAYHLAHEISGSHGAWIMAFATSFTTGVLICFVIPVGLSMLQKKDHKYLALGVMAGVLATPLAVFIISLTLQVTQVPLRSDISTNSESTSPFDLSIGSIFLNVLPLIIFAVVLALLMRYLTNFMVRAFIIFGRVLQGFLVMALAVSAVEYFTGFFSLFFDWPLDPFMADEVDQLRALEVAGTVGLMLAGAFPLVYAIRTWFAKPLERVGGKVGFSKEGSAGIIAAIANVLALFHVIKDMPVRDKVVTLAFSVSGAFTFADHLAFTANFQPNMVLILLVGKLIGGIIGIVIALWLAVPTALRFEAEDLAKEREAATPHESAHASV